MLTIHFCFSSKLQHLSHILHWYFLLYAPNNLKVLVMPSCKCLCFSQKKMKSAYVRANVNVCKQWARVDSCPCAFRNKWAQAHARTYPSSQAKSMGTHAHICTFAIREGGHTCVHVNTHKQWTRARMCACNKRGHTRAYAPVRMQWARAHARKQQSNPISSKRCFES